MRRQKIGYSTDSCNGKNRKRIEKERLSIPVVAFHFLEQQDFKALLIETEEVSTCSICIQKSQKNTSTRNGVNQLQDIESSKVSVNSNVPEFRKYSKNYQSANVKMIIQKR